MKNMHGGEIGTTPATIQALSNSLIDKGCSYADLVTGATGTADKFKTLMGELFSCKIK